MRAHWKYEMQDGSTGEVTTFPVDIVVAEKVTKTLLTQGASFEFMAVAVHNSLKRRAKKEGGAIVGFQEWLEDLAELSDRGELEVTEEDLSPFGDSDSTPGQPPSGSVF